MRQFQFYYEDQESLRRELMKIRQWQNTRIHSGIVFQVLSEILDQPLLEDIQAQIHEMIPDALIMGCSTNGNICEGKFSGKDIAIVCTVCEFPSTKVEVFQYELRNETAAQVTSDLLAKIGERPWVKAVEMLVTIRGMSMSLLCDELQKMREDIAVFGGGAFSNDIDENAACVFSSAGEYSQNGVVFLLIGGEDVSVETAHITGWKPLGRTFRVTRAEHNILYELDGSPAYDVYYKYLNIRNDSHFFFNSLEFPFFYEHNGIRILRAPTASNPDGSLVMTADMEQNVSANLAYGDPWTILDSIRTSSQKIRDFAPEIIHVYSCAARRTFWGVSEVSKETLPFQAIAPTSGFYTSGEFLRTNGKMNQHNVTLVVAGLREGAPSAALQSEVEHTGEEYSGRVSMINRLATFIDAATHELEEANAKLERAAITDGMTQLYNRSEIQRRIREQLQSGGDLSLVMLDIDNFKRVNDTFGHKEGDLVIKGLSGILRNGEEKYPESAAGRWGGEEFMLMIPWKLEKSEKTAACLREQFSALEFPAAGHQTVSIGVTQAIPGEPLDDLLIRVDKALYEAKHSGKNRYVVL